MTFFSSPVFGSRHFVSAAGDFVVGGCYIVKGISPTSTVSTIPNNVFGSDGNGGALFYSGSLVNVLLRAGGTSLNAQAYTQATPWNTISPNPGSADIGGNGLGYNLVYEGRLFNIPSGALGSPGPASYLGFCEFDNWPNRGYLLVLVDAQYGNYNSPAPLLAPSPPGRYVIPLGEVAGDNTPMFVVRDGIVVRGADGNMRFYGWDGQLKGTTRDDGASGRVYLDFSPVDYYYVFDPSSLKLYKARNWWQKN